MNMSPENIGKRVKWESQAKGYWTEKEGTIVGICETGLYPKAVGMKDFPGHRLMFDSVSVAKENTKRYFVEVRNGGNAKPLLYYPRLNRMELTDEEEQK